MKRTPKKMPAEFTQYLLNGIRAIREAATPQAMIDIHKNINPENREIAHRLFSRSNKNG